VPGNERLLHHINLVGGSGSVILARGLPYVAAILGGNDRL